MPTHPFKERELTLRTFSTGSMHLRNMSMHSSSNRALVMLVLKSMPSNRLSISMVVCAEADRVRFARSQAVLRRRTALGLPEMSFFDLRLNSCMHGMSQHELPKLCRQRGSQPYTMLTAPSFCTYLACSTPDVGSSHTDSSTRSNEAAHLG